MARIFISYKRQDKDKVFPIMEEIKQNNMKRRLFIVLLQMMISFGAVAQVQTGYVRTVGRPNNLAGTRLPGATIRVTGLHSPVVSGTNGAFEFNLQGGKSSYKFSSVSMNDYELNEKELIGRECGVTKVPHEIVMISLKEKRQIEENVRNQVEQKYQKKYKDLQKQLEEKTITIETYRERLAELEAIFEKRDQLVNDMVERYSHTDYAKLSSKEAEINSFIERGELERADSVISTLNLEKREKDRARMLQAKEQIDQAIAQNDSVLIMGYSKKIERFKADFQNDSVAIYYDKLLAIDNTNTDFLDEASEFLRDYLADYDKALQLVSLGLDLKLKKHGENHPDVATSNNNIGVAYERQGNYDKALEYYNKAISIFLNVSGENHPDVATCYNNIGGVYDNQGNYDKAWEYYNKALTIKLNVLGENHLDVATCYNNIGLVYYRYGNYDKALEYYNKALAIFLIVLGENHPSVATIYNNIGMVYDDQGNYDKALEYYNKALLIKLNLLGENHPNVAISYNNIGLVYRSQGNYDKALEYHNKALAIFLIVLGENHPSVAPSYNNMGMVYNKKGNYDKALEYYNKSIAILLNVLGENHTYVATIYNNIGTVYDDQGNYEKALEYYNKSFKIFLNILGENHPSVATIYNNIAGVYEKIGDSAKATEYRAKAKAIEQAKKGVN